MSNINIYTFNDNDYIKLKELEQLNIYIDSVLTSDQTLNNEKKTILTNIKQSLTTTLRINYYTLQSPNKLILYEYNNSIDNYISINNCECMDIIYSINNHTYSIGDYNDHLFISDIINLDTKHINNNDIVSNKLDLYNILENNIQSLENKLSTMSMNMENINKKLFNIKGAMNKYIVVSNIDTKSNLVKYNYEEIKNRNSKLNNEFKRIFKLLKLSFIN